MYIRKSIETVCDCFARQEIEDLSEKHDSLVRVVALLFDYIGIDIKETERVDSKLIIVKAKKKSKK